MIKVLTKEYLATYMYLESEIKRIRRRIKYYEEHPIPRLYGVVKGSLEQFPYTECNFVVSGPTIKSDEERKKLVRQLIIDLKGNERLFEDMKLEIECFLEKIPPSQLQIKRILFLKYVDRKTDFEIAAELGCDRSTINKKIDRYLQSVECLQGSKVLRKSL